MTNTTFKHGSIVTTLGSSDRIIFDDGEMQTAINVLLQHVLEGSQAALRVLVNAPTPAAQRWLIERNLYGVTWFAPVQLQQAMDLRANLEERLHDEARHSLITA